MNDILDQLNAGDDDTEDSYFRLELSYEVITPQGMEHWERGIDRILANYPGCERIDSGMGFGRRDMGFDLTNLEGNDQDHLVKALYELDPPDLQISLFHT